VATRRVLPPTRFSARSNDFFTLSTRDFNRAVKYGCQAARPQESVQENIMAAMLITSAALLTCGFIVMAIFDLLPRGR
jgi:hypothetical protein